MLVCLLLYYTLYKYKALQLYAWLYDRNIGLLSQAYHGRPQLALEVLNVVQTISNYCPKYVYNVELSSIALQVLLITVQTLNIYLCL